MIRLFHWLKHFFRQMYLLLSCNFGSWALSSASSYDKPGNMIFNARTCILSMSSLRYWQRPGCHAAHAYSSTGLILVIYMSLISLLPMPALRHNTNKCNLCEAFRVIYSTCLFHLRSSLTMTPSILEWWTTSMGVLSINNWLTLPRILLKSMRISKVLVALIDMSFLLDHSSAVLASSCKAVELILSLTSIMVVSSTYLEYGHSNRRSFMWTINKMTPNRVPCGAPPRSCSQLDRAPPILTCCCRAVRKDAIQRSNTGGEPRVDSFWRMIWWLIKSKALE